MIRYKGYTIYIFPLSNGMVELRCKITPWTIETNDNNLQWEINLLKSEIDEESR